MGFLSQRPDTNSALVAFSENALRLLASAGLTPDSGFPSATDGNVNLLPSAHPVTQLAFSGDFAGAVRAQTVTLSLSVGGKIPASAAGLKPNPSLTVLAPSNTQQAVAANKLVAAIAAKTSFVAIAPEHIATVTPAEIGTAPASQTPPGGNSAFGASTVLTHANGTSYLRSGWLGADPLAGQYGDTGGFDNIDANDTFTSGAANVRQNPLTDSNLKTAAEQASLNTLAGDQSALQGIINVDSFLLNNINVPHPSSNVAANNVYVQLQDQFVTAASATDVPSLAEGAECAAAIGASGIIFATGEGTTVSLAAGAFALLGGTQACESVINYLDGDVSAAFGWFGYVTSDLAGAQQGMADVNTNQNHPDVTNVVPSPRTFGPTPGFVPGQAFLDAVKGHLTSAAMAKYFPHG